MIKFSIDEINITKIEIQKNNIIYKKKRHIYSKDTAIRYLLKLSQ